MHCACAETARSRRGDPAGNWLTSKAQEDDPSAPSSNFSGSRPARKPCLRVEYVAYVDEAVLTILLGKAITLTHSRSGVVHPEDVSSSIQGNVSVPNHPGSRVSPSPLTATTSLAGQGSGHARGDPDLPNPSPSLKSCRAFKAMPQQEQMNAVDLFIVVSLDIGSQHFGQSW